MKSEKLDTFQMVFMESEKKKKKLASQHKQIVRVLPCLPLSRFFLTSKFWHCSIQEPTGQWLSSVVQCRIVEFRFSSVFSIKWVPFSLELGLEITWVDPQAPKESVSVVQPCRNLGLA